MYQPLTCLAVIACSIAVTAGARGATLLVASDASQIEELHVAQVMARDSSIWLSVSLRAQAQLALVTGDSLIEPAPSADPWLRALDFTTRVRVAAPSGVVSSCGSGQPPSLVDTGLPDSLVIDAERLETVGSELELRRALQDAGLPAEPERIARFASEVAAPFRILLYAAPNSGGTTAAIRLRDHENVDSTPQIATAYRDAVPITLLSLASAAVVPPDASSADSSEFPVTYRFSSSVGASTDYLGARASWLSEHPQRWLLETQSNSSLFAWTALTPKDLLAPAVSRYFRDFDGSCTIQVRDAYARRSQRAVDYTCGDHDDLALSLAQLGFGDARLTRWYGRLTSDAIPFQVVDAPARSPLVIATDIDEKDCVPSSVVTPSVGAGMSAPGPTAPVAVSDPGSSGISGADPGTPVYTDDGNCNVVIVDSSSCSGDSSSNDASSSDSCSGDSSHDGSSACSGDSSSSDSSSGDSCSGDSDSSDDSGGCGKSDGYDGDTCTGNSHASAEALGTASAALGSAERNRTPRPRRVHLSLLTLLATAVVLPFRRLRAFHF